MSFWSGEKLKIKLSEGGSELVSPYDERNIDCASYRLSVGSQAFVTSESLNSTTPQADLITVLHDAPNHMLRISPGQFAFILTEETVTVPNNAIALISMRAKYKFKGLINVSGFHVDPGWKGKLLFSIYNAGPQPVVVEKGEAVFLIVYADLDIDSELIYEGGSKEQNSIKPELLDKLSGQVFSPHALKESLEKLDTKVSSFDRSIGIVQAVTAGLGVFIGLFLGFAAILATMFPQVPGIILAETLILGGYTIDRQNDSSSNRTATSIEDIQQEAVNNSSEIRE